MAYLIIIFIHSWLRWVVILAGVAIGVRATSGTMTGRPWKPIDELLGRVFVSALDTQILLGLVLFFFFSPVTPKSMADLRACMHVAPLRFFAVEHTTGMIVALVSAHVGWALGKRATSARVRHRRVAIGVGIALLVIAASIPWPGLSYGRPLVRGL
jgi:hypothetical protein